MNRKRRRCEEKKRKGEKKMQREEGEAENRAETVWNK